MAVSPGGHIVATTMPTANNSIERKSFRKISSFYLQERNY
jgi:hypothetical protein